MSRNDQVLLDSVLNKLQKKDKGKYDLPKQFELFSFTQLLKSYDLSIDEIAFGWVDGSDDGGIDGFYTFVDEKLVTGPIVGEEYRRNPTVDLLIVTCKLADSFAQIPINNLISSLPELFDLSKTADELISAFNDKVLRARELFRNTYVELTAKNPQLSIRVIYGNRGDTTRIAKNIRPRATLLTNKLHEWFRDATVSVEFCGASELLSLYRTTRTFSLRLPFIENSISRSKNSYIVLSRLDDFYRFVDDGGKLRRYLFDSNVRDYVGSSAVNEDIAQTLSSGETKEDVDFWLLNNGITILASTVSVVGKEICIENIQIVNGLQTTESIHSYFSAHPNAIDDRALLIKVIVANEDVVRDRIIKATNNQNKVDAASLKATDKIQKDIEHVLLDSNWYYDRRKNYYLNQGMPEDRIITPAFIYKAVCALCLKELERAGELSEPGFPADEKVYARVFNKGWKIEVFLACTEIIKKCEAALLQFDFHLPDTSNADMVQRYLYICAYVYAAISLGDPDYQANDLVKLASADITDDTMKRIWRFVDKKAKLKFKEESGAKAVHKPHRNTGYHATIKRILKNEITRAS